MLRSTQLLSFQGQSEFVLRVMIGFGLVEEVHGGAAQPYLPQGVRQGCGVGSRSQDGRAVLRMG